MKVQDINQISNTMKEVPCAGTDTNAGLSFSKLLEAQLIKAPQVNNSNSVSRIAGTTPVVISVRIESLALSEEILAMLDSYGNALADHSLALPELQPYIEDLEEKASALLALKNQIPAQDSLAKLVDHVATTAYLETAKFRRGDYFA